MELLDQLSEMTNTPARDAAGSLDELLTRVRETGIPTTLTEGDTPVAVLMSWDVFEELESATAGLRHANHRLQGCRFGPIKPTQGTDCGCRTAEEMDAELAQEGL
ncbi:type II toxin-antitoxin system Phd/YefM family antitoxin [Streptomyces albipurpureus]|uniref:Type II toxin-antitoxin system Phd/YefM family antitoxin n=1 Tax=Streptomyces albipurpureus TaxID=2897419 RepID=A0ABT0UKA4_9ACTN|nr:type II toxin-antitoxin system Phd/YefM family antitoxin [Streptomyces sp. CWNU-1]MCM2387818.1 type II toxin-antitoxin system Phd/YefM family antitoxin [Streptomyces sp. CWNU-1]